MLVLKRILCFIIALSRYEKVRLIVKNILYVLTYDYRFLEEKEAEK